jgi:mannose-6-phosphate isomerase-like protein (cupin superfamily)
VVLHNRHTGETLALRRIAQDGQVCVEMKGTLPPHNEGPPLHVHFAETEEGLIVAGTLSAVVDGQEVMFGAGQRATFPAGSVHRWWNDGDEMLVFEGLARPVFYMAHVAWRHRRTQSLRIIPRGFKRSCYRLSC